MVKSFRMHLIIPILLILCASCKKTQPLTDIGEKPQVVDPVPVPPKDTVVVPPSAKIYNLGTGSGNLTIDGKSLGITGNSVIKIKGGSYDDVQISNIIVENATVLIQNDGLVEFVGNKQLTLSNLKNVAITGNGTAGIEKGFVFRDKTSDAPSIQLRNDINNFTLKQVSFKNVNTYNAIQYDSQKIYNGTESSYSKNLKFLNIDCDNTGTLIRLRGSAENGVVTGLVKDVEIAYVTFKNSRAVGSAIVLENADTYDVHNNYVQNINQDNNNHNGVFYLQGNGKFYNNYVKDHQGNAIRAWIYSIGNTPAEVLIFNNIVANSREYGAFELQAFARNIISGKTTYANAKVFNNTCGNLLPKSGSFPAQVLDLYGLQGGKCEIFNNLGYKFPLVGQNNTNFIWNELGDTKATAYSNKYFGTSQEAGIQSETTFYLNSNSGAKNAGASLSNAQTSFAPTINLDYYATARNTTNPSIGAVE